MVNAPHVVSRSPRVEMLEVRNGLRRERVCRDWGTGNGITVPRRVLVIVPAALPPDAVRERLPEVSGAG